MFNKIKEWNENRKKKNEEKYFKELNDVHDSGRRPEQDMITGMLTKMAYVWIALIIISTGFTMLISSTQGDPYKSFCMGFNGKYLNEGITTNYSTCDILTPDANIHRFKVLCVDSNCQLQPEEYRIILSH